MCAVSGEYRINALKFRGDSHSERKTKEEIHILKVPHLMDNVHIYLRLHLFNQFIICVASV